MHPLKHSSSNMKSKQPDQDYSVGDKVKCNLYFLGTWYGHIKESTNTFYLIDFAECYKNPPFSTEVWVSRRDIISEKFLPN